MTVEPALGAEAMAEDRLRRARAALRGAEVRMGAPSQGWQAPALPCAKGLDAVVPAGLRRGQVVSVTGSTSLMLALVAETSREGAWTAMIGMPHVGVVAASRRGIELSRLALIPHPGIHAAAAAGACLEGMDVVLLGEGLALSFADRRRLMTRARERGAVLVVAGSWEGAHTSLIVESHRWLGLGAGDGRLRERQLTVAVGGRTHGNTRRVSLTLDEDSGARWARPGVRHTLDEGVA
jgi:hypothetical protein